MKPQTSTAAGEAVPCSALRLDSCFDFERIGVRTQHTAYDLIVLPGRDGSVLVRGGRFFPSFQRATVAGAIAGRGAEKVMMIAIGRPLELALDDKYFVTSRVESISKGRFGGERAA